ncbi:MAG: ATP-binding cassette domain-containing protein [Thiomicrorhabdus sp.]|nr:ATP-binding cassette domain-containing protein [Thiomicrorhabdus sp.]
MTASALLEVKGLKAEGMSQAVDISVFSGQVWMVIGSSGTGKSQFLKSLADLIEHEGDVHLNGVNQQTISAEQWRKQVMYFAAETAWWQDTVVAHFESPPDKTVLKSIGLPSDILQKNPDACSSGEKQRLALLRGLSYQPTILLLDEITANLDTEASIKVEKLLQNYLKTPVLNAEIGGEKISSPPKKAIIWVSHDVAQRQRMASVEQHLTFQSKADLV